MFEAKIEVVPDNLGVLLDDKLTFVFHFQKTKTKVGLHCDIVSKMRHKIPTPFLLKYYHTNVKSIKKNVGKIVFLF